MPNCADPFILFTQPASSSCIRAKEFLSRKGIEFVSIDVLIEPGAREQLLNLGMRNVPVLAQGRRCILAQNMEEVAAFVGLDGTGHTRLPPAVRTLYGHGYMCDCLNH